MASCKKVRLFLVGAADHHIHLPACRLCNSRRVRDEYGEREYGSIVAAKPDSVTPPLQIPDQEEHQDSSSSHLSESFF